MTNEGRCQTCGLEDRRYYEQLVEDVKRYEAAPTPEDVIQACAAYIEANYGDEGREFSKALSTQYWGPVLKSVLPLRVLGAVYDTPATRMKSSD